MNVPEAKYFPEYFHQKLGKILWESCGMSRERVRLEQAINEIETLQLKFWKTIKVTGIIIKI